MDDEVGYHSSRALAELDRARRCLDLQAAQGHLRRAGKHVERMRILSEAGGRAGA